MFSKLFIFSVLITFLSSCQQDITVNDTRKKSDNQIRIAAAQDPTTLDARLGVNLTTATYLRMLYEGLMRTDFDGKLIPALAESIDVSPDHKTYTFKLRESVWSDEYPFDSG